MRLRSFLLSAIGLIAGAASATAPKDCLQTEKFLLNKDATSTNVALAPQTRDPSAPKIPRATFQSPAGRLVIEIVHDDIVRFEWNRGQALPAADEPIYRSPLVAQEVHDGPSAVDAKNHGTVLETPTLRIEVDPKTLGFTVFDKRKQHLLATVTPESLSQDYKFFNIDNTAIGDPEVEGLGVRPRVAPSIDAGWKGQNFFDPTSFGNGMTPFDNGAPVTSQMPVAFFHSGEKDGRYGEHNYGLFVDNPDKTEWWFDRPGRGKVGMWGDYPRMYLIAGETLPQIHQKFMKLQGYPDLPPRHITGWGISQFSFNNWYEPFEDLRRLEAAGMPLPRHVYLDLAWFGETFQGVNNEPSRMGTMEWDRREGRFPHPEETVKWLKDRGIEIIPISESYVDRSVPDYQYMADHGYFVKDPDTGQPVVIDPRGEGFWKWAGSMVDWSNPEACDYWFRTRHLRLARMGIHTFWHDLGDPERYPMRARYRAAGGEGTNQADNHNLYNNLWVKMVTDGYRKYGINERPTVISRAMTIGPKSLNWSGDIDGDPDSLNAHLRMALDASWAGQFFLMSDAGGFHRNWKDWHYGQLYTRWLATVLRGGEFPARVHVWNIDKSRKYVPTDVGEFNSNKAALEEREAMVPYYYSLMWDAHLNAAPIRSATSFYFQKDRAIKGLSEFVVGRKDLLIAVSTNIDENARDVQLPEGHRWVNWDTHEAFDGGQLLKAVACRDADLKFRPPTFARAGAMFPRTEQERATIERNKNFIPPVNHDFILRVFPDRDLSTFRRYDSDGHTRDFEKGAFRTTDIEQQVVGKDMTVTIAPSQGTYTGAPEKQKYKIEFATLERNVDKVLANGRELPPCADKAEFDRREEGYYIDPKSRLIVVKTGEQRVDQKKTFTVRLK